MWWHGERFAIELTIDLEIIDFAYHFNTDVVFISFFFIVLFPAILQRTTVDVGQIRLQGVATCLYLCMDACGNMYGSVRIIFVLYL